ncbi:hypothetical protein EDB81DRAFT_907415 [Dactylonectria macrodidyma]|uniref:ATP-dependent DNA ligase family profile domain-containing protein n=1 Tax=Dactylonectria macrodidyma TaxID=307937 RepID=A0A9P9INN1_9HYPO|nr:hypothetical protein EDB81DRAFT_907415 [Dactylonectria macrodidyma]
MAYCLGLDLKHMHEQQSVDLFVMFEKEGILQERQLEGIIQRAQCLGSYRMRDLQRWKTSGCLDFASSVEHVMAITDNESRAGREITLEELDDRSRPLAYGKESQRSMADQSVQMTYFRNPARVLETLVMSRFHFLLPDLLRFQNSIPAAIGFLDSTTIRHMPIQPAVDAYNKLKEVIKFIRRIEPFHKIRRYVKRSERFFRAARDSPVESSEHLMIMFYDILLLDDIVCGLDTHDERRRRLQSLVRRIPGRTDIGSREVIEFSSFDAAERLSKTFARAISHRREGFALKGCDDPYFSFNRSRPFIKLKKDYIPGLGDTADFVIIGGRRDAGDEHEVATHKTRSLTA